MKLFKKIVCITLALGLALSIAACETGGNGGGGGGNDDDDYFGGGAGGKTVVRFYSFNNSETNAELKKALKDDFYVKNPDIYVQTEISTGSFYTNLLNDFAGKVEADVFGMEPGEIYPFLSAGYLEPLDNYFAASETVSLDDVWDINKAAYSYDSDTKTFGSGKTYAVMKDWTTDSMLFYNRSLFTADQLAMIEADDDGDGVADPLTFAEFETLCDQLLKRSGSTITQYSFLPGLAEAKVLAQFITNAGLSWFDPANGYQSTFTNPAVKEVVKYYYDILGKNDVNNVGSTFMPIFAQGKVAMIMGGLYCIEAYGLDSLDLGVAYPPVKDDSIECKPYTTGCVGFAISSRSKVKDAAFKFIEWYLNYYGAIDARKCNNFPAMKKYANDMLNPEVNTDPVRLRCTQFFHDSLSKAVVIDRNPYCSQASLESVEFAYTGEYLEGEMSFNEFCETLDYEINKRVRQAKQAE
ncbi:MAG: extracellular solute-binding protein [Clostridia bacterium]|nr:extracellular solute-binding protein [Clostridia bacterium]